MYTCCDRGVTVVLLQCYSIVAVLEVHGVLPPHPARKVEGRRHVFTCCDRGVTVVLLQCYSIVEVLEVHGVLPPHPAREVLDPLSPLPLPLHISVKIE
jgi:hypothetical protein